MPAIALRGDYTVEPVRGIAARARDADQARRLLSIAAVYDGMSRADAARIGAMDRQTLRDWVHRFNDTGLINRKAPGATPKLTAEQVAELSRIVAVGPDPERDGVVRWRCLDLKGLIRERYGVDYHERSVGKLLAALGFAHVSARPQHLGQDPEALETFKKKTSRTAWRRS